MPFQIRFQVYTQMFILCQSFFVILNNIKIRQLSCKNICLNKKFFCKQNSKFPSSFLISQNFKPIRRLKIIFKLFFPWTLLITVKVSLFFEHFCHTKLHRIIRRERHRKNSEFQIESYDVLMINYSNVCYLKTGIRFILKQK